MSAPERPGATTLEQKQRYCAGCHDDFYNQAGNAMNGKHCWSLPDATVKRRFKLHWWTSPVAPGAFAEVETLSCWHSPGNWSMSDKPHPEAVNVRRLAERAQ